MRIPVEIRDRPLFSSPYLVVKRGASGHRSRRPRILVGTRVVPKATARNLVRRLIFEAARQWPHGNDLLFVVRRDLGLLDKETLKRHLHRVLAEAQAALFP